MLIKRAVLDGIRAGDITLQFRRWKRRTVSPGGTLRTAVGVLNIGAIVPVDEAALSDADARMAGFADANELRRWLAGGGRDGILERIEIGWSGEDPRAGLRDDDALSAETLSEIAGRLDAIDARSRDGAWTARAMDLIAARPAVAAAELAAETGLEKPVFKSRIRRLKELGLTESLETGYRLSPRGERVHSFRRKAG
jgi:hypothetical protein